MANARPSDSRAHCQTMGSAYPAGSLMDTLASTSRGDLGLWHIRWYTSCIRKRRKRRMRRKKRKQRKRRTRRKRPIGGHLGPARFPRMGYLPCHSLLGTLQQLHGPTTCASNRPNRDIYAPDWPTKGRRARGSRASASCSLPCSLAQGENPTFAKPESHHARRLERWANEPPLGFNADIWSQTHCRDCAGLH